MLKYLILTEHDWSQTGLEAGPFPEQKQYLELGIYEISPESSTPLTGLLNQSTAPENSRIKVIAKKSLEDERKSRAVLEEIIIAKGGIFAESLTHLPPEFKFAETSPYYAQGIFSTDQKTALLAYLQPSSN